MTRYVLDTDVLIDYFRGHDPTVLLIERLYRQRETLCTCAAIIAEMHSGLAPRDRGEVTVLLGSLHFLSTTPRAAGKAGDWRYAFARQGLQLSTTDCLIAATTVEAGATLITGNARHFPMSELNVMSNARQ